MGLPLLKNDEFVRTKFNGCKPLHQKADLIREAIKAPIQLTAERCKRSFYHFMQVHWETVCNDTPRWNWHIPYLCEKLTDLAKRVAAELPKENDLIINIPPGTTKSLTASVMFPAFSWAIWPWMRFITASYSGALALEQAELCRDVVRSDIYQSLFPHIRIKRDKDTKSNFKIQEGRVKAGHIYWYNGGNRFSTSVGGTLTGFHGHILLVDDPLDPSRAVSKTEVEKANRWVGQTLSTRKVEKAITPTALIMQRLAQDDPSGVQLAKKRKKIFHICLPGELKNFKDQVKPPELVNKYVDGLLDPVRMPRDVLTEMNEDLGQYGYAGQVGQRPDPPGGGMFKTDHFQIIHQMPSEYNIIKTVRYWDKAGTTTEEGGKAGTAGVKLLTLRNGKYLIPDVKHGLWSSEVRERIIRETAEADGVGCRVYHEQEPGSGGKESAEGTTRNLAGFMVQADRPTGNKVYRADPYSVQVNNGNVLLLHGDWNAEFITEHKNFRGDGKGTYPKDQVDGAAGAFNKSVGKKLARRIT